MFNISEKQAEENKSRDKLSEAVVIMKSGRWHAAGLRVATGIRRACLGYTGRFVVVTPRPRLLEECTGESS